MGKNDINDRIEELEKQVEQLSQLNFLYKQVINNLPLGIQIFDDKGISFEINEKQKEILGLPNLNEGIGKFNVLTDPYSKAMGADKIYSQAYSGKKFQHEFEYDLSADENTWNTLKRKKTFNEIIFPIKQDGNIQYVVALLQDITETKTNQVNLQKASDELRILLDNAPGFIIFKDTENNLIRISETVARMTGLPKEKIEGKAAKDIYPDMADEYYKDDKEVIESRKPKRGIIEPLPSVNGDTKWLITDKVPYFNEEDTVAGIIVFSTDITKIKEAESELIKAKEKAEESDRLKTQFLNNMSHEIRTPMNGIIGFSELLDDPDTNDEKRKYYSKIIQSSSQQLLKVIDDIVEISTLETKQVKYKDEQFCLNDFMMELFSIFNLKAKAKGIQIYLKKGLSNNNSKIKTDRLKLTKVLNNLIENSIKYTNEGYIEIGYKVINQSLEIYIKDTGAGIPPESMDNIFKRFSRAGNDLINKYGGLGLGLSIAKENTNLLGGDISVSSIEGKGSTFTVTIPYKAGEKDHENQNASVTTEKEKTYQVLVAEDDEVNYLYLETIIEAHYKSSIKLIHARNGLEAVNLANKTAGIDLVLMDLKMPIMNGYDATLKLKRKNPQLIVIAQTAFSSEADEKKALNIGCSDFISKPIPKDSLINMIDKYLKIKPA